MEKHGEEIHKEDQKAVDVLKKYTGERAKLVQALKRFNLECKRYIRHRDRILDRLQELHLYLLQFPPHYQSYALNRVEVELFNIREDFVEFCERYGMVSKEDCRDKDEY
jgi:hypothetical protein